MIREIGVSLILGWTLLGCTTTQPSESREYTQPSREEVYEHPSQPQQPQPENISVREAYAMIEKGGVTLLDVRAQPETLTDGKIANSQLIPLQVLGSYLGRLEKGQPILVYCRTGNRSAVAANLLRGQGFNAINVLGGIYAWKSNGLPVE